MRQPEVFLAIEIQKWQVSEERNGRWIPARDMSSPGTLRWSMIRMRLSCAWKVFTGQYDALNWEPPNEPT